MVLDLIKSGDARWIYCNEGNNNIAVIFKVFTPKADLDAKYHTIIEAIDNSVFRIKKKVRSKYLVQGVISDEIEYLKHFYNHIAMNDKEMLPFLCQYKEITLSTEIIDSINSAIRSDRDIMIAEAQINYPLKTFQGIDTDLRYACVMANLGSNYTVPSKGIVKHIELKLGLIVPKPMQSSFLKHLDETYSPDQCERMKWFKNKSRFNAKQANLKLRGKSDRFCSFNPHVMTSGEPEAMKSALQELFTNGTGYAKIFQGGEQYDITERDLEIIVEFLNQGLLKQIEKYQSLDESDLDEIADLYQQVITEDPDPKESIHRYFASFHSSEVEKSPDQKLVESQWKRVLDWIVSETVKDSSIMLRWVESTENDIPTHELDTIKIIDVDTKL